MTDLQHYPVFLQQSFDMSEQPQAREHHRVVMVRHSLPGLLKQCFSLTHEEVHGLLDKAVQHMGVV